MHYQLCWCDTMPMYQMDCRIVSRLHTSDDRYKGIDPQPTKRYGT